MTELYVLFTRRPSARLVSHLAQRVAQPRRKTSVSERLLRGLVQQFQVHQVQRLDGIPLFNDARDAAEAGNDESGRAATGGRKGREDELDFACALRDHLDVDIALGEGAARQE